MKLDLFTEDDTLQLIQHIQETHNPLKPLLLYIDLFCGAGGVTEGFQRIENLFVVACVNHDLNAIKSHHENHPKCIHYTEDIRNWAVIRKIETLILKLKEAFPQASVGLHASLECTHFSKAKGGLSRDADSRTLANHLTKYLCIDIDYITIENVEEFLTWGPLYQVTENDLWKFQTKKSKNVFYDSPYIGNEDFYDSLELTPFQLPVKERKCEFYNDWLVDMKRYGFEYEYKTLNAADYGAFTNRKRYFGVFASKGLPISFPKPTHISLKKWTKECGLKPHNAVSEKLELEIHGNSIFGLNKNNKYYSLKTVARVYYGLLKFWKEGYFIVRYNGGNLTDKCITTKKPLGALLTANTYSLVHPLFLSSYYGNSQKGQGIHRLEDPCNTIPTKDTFALHHLQYAYGKSIYSDMNQPAGTITKVPKQELVTTQWLYDTQFDRVGNSIKKPAPTVIARQDKKPLYMATAKNNSEVDNSIWKEDDAFIVMLLKTFMREHGITDVKIRSLFVNELSGIQGFPKDYKFIGGETNAKKFIGNSVCPDIAEALANEIINNLPQLEDAVY